jgi:hypothetical protein
LGQEIVSITRQVAAESENDEFQRGRLFGLYEVMSLMKQQAVVFGLSERQIGLNGVDFEDLLM